MRFLIFGSSSSYGTGDIECDGWVNRLSIDLKKENNNIKFFNLGIGGDSSKKLLKRFENEVIPRYKKNETGIIFSIGTNDSCFYETKDKPEINIKKFEKNLQKLTKIAKKYTDKIIFLGLTKIDERKTLPASWYPAYYDNENIKIYNKIIKKVSEKNSITYIHLYNLFDIEKDLYDGLHPNPKGHDKIAKTIKKHLKANILK